MMAIDDLEPILINVLKTSQIPSLAAAVVSEDELIGLGVHGLRKWGSESKVTVSDRYHIGSNTKSMTATLIANYIDEGKLSWDTEIIDIFPEWKISIQEDFKKVTVHQLLCHMSGVPENPPMNAWSEAWQKVGTPKQQRVKFVQTVLSEPPQAKPGSKFIYSNQNYAIAGAMLEKITNASWEDLIQSKIFSPLNMNMSGFGAPASVNIDKQPWGHIEKENKIEAVPPEPAGDNPPAIAPAGGVHCSIEDLAHYVQFHLKGMRGNGSLLKNESYKKLYTPWPKQSYALGWMIVPRAWAGGDAFTHAGSNTMFYNVIWIAPKKNIAFIIATNVGGDKAFEACDKVAELLVEKYIK
jgi:CubicO group peptidase (beta-lactamase class C family)